MVTTRQRLRHRGPAVKRVGGCCALNICSTDPFSPASSVQSACAVRRRGLVNTKACEAAPRTLDPGPWTLDPQNLLKIPRLTAICLPNPDPVKIVRFSFGPL